MGSGAKTRPQREELLQAARRRAVDAFLVWRLDRWGRSLVDLVTTLQELVALGVGCIAHAEALDFTMPGGRALAGMLAVFAEFERDILRERVRAGILAAKKRGTQCGRPPTAALLTKEVQALAKKGRSRIAIGRELNISPTSVRRRLG